MKILFYLFSTLILLSTSACKSKQKAQTTEKVENAKVINNTTPLTEKGCYVTVTFGSPGTGIDTKKYDEITSLIKSKKLKSTETVKGREGEKEICLSLAELNLSEKEVFVDQLKKAAEGGQLVSISTN
jgi:hypothetical protein